MHVLQEIARLVDPLNESPSEKEGKSAAKRPGTLYF